VEQYKKDHGPVSSPRYSARISEAASDVSAEERLRRSERLKGEKNPWRDHGGKYSPFSKRGKNYDPSMGMRAATTRKRNGTQPTSIEYFMKLAGGDRDLAEQMLSERQRTFTLEKCVARHGLEEGTRVFNDRQHRWNKSFKKNNYSRVSQELFRAIMEHHSGDVYFAEHDRPDMEGYANKELRLQLSNGRSMMPDFVDVGQKKIIEFDGTYWHRNDSVNKGRAEEKDRQLKDDGWQVLRVREIDFSKSRSWVVAVCLSFLRPSRESS
jgi:very-short-patch-repair endonuclease